MTETQLQVQVRPRRAGKTAEQAVRFSEAVNRLVRSTAKEQRCGVTVKQAAGWTTAEIDPEVEAGRIHYVKF